MKNLLNKISLLAALLLLSSCWPTGGGTDDDFNPPPQQYSPVAITRTELEASVQALPQRDIVKSGKIYIKDNLMFINDVNKGFHVYNYSNPQSPVKTAYLNIPGATDLAIRNNIIYINQAVDLVTIEYNALNNTITSAHRNRDVFPTKVSPDGQFAYVNDGEIVIDWTQN